MQVEISTPLRTVAMTFTRKVSGGEVAVQVRADGRAVYWMNGHRISRATAARKLGH